ncbi:MAG TPA: hemerythrin domain-containing protein [Clostridiaceae bacterium]
MDSIELMVNEHSYIKRMLEVVRKANLKVLFQDDINYEDFNHMISFIRNYADAHHHGKEEKLLFNRMVSEIGGAAEKLVNNGMLVEHDMGRFFIKELEEALEKVKNGDQEAKLDVIANAISYANLLARHIDKEDKVVYTFAKRALSKNTFDIIDKECEVFEKEMSDKGIQKKYLLLLEELENKYI